MKICELLGKPHKKITADRFLDAFREQWKEEDPDEIIETYSNNENWTEFMLGNVTGNQIGDVFLNRVAKRFLMTMDREWRKLDCVYYKKESSQIKGKESYPACLDAVIEHGWRYMTVRSGEFERRSRLSPSESPATALILNSER